MKRIDTEVPEIIVEIEDNEYTVAPRTVEICDKLLQAEKDYAGKPVYQLWLAELEIMLGKPACRKLFGSGKRENVDRIQMIYAGVAQAFKYTEDSLKNQARESEVDAVAAALAPLNELMRNINRLDKAANIREIRRE